MKRIFSLTLMATLQDCRFASACNPGKVSIDLAVCSPASHGMTKGAHECSTARSTRRSCAAGLEAAFLPELIFSVFIVVSYITGAGVPSDHIPVRVKNTHIGSGWPLNWGFR